MRIGSGKPAKNRKVRKPSQYYGGLMNTPNMLTSQERSDHEIAAKFPRSRTVRVDAATIEDAKKADSSHCMIAEAIKKQFDVKNVNVDLQGIRYTDTQLNVRVFHLTPPAAQDHLLAFDQGDPVTPFKFRLGPPAIMVKARQKFTRKISHHHKKPMPAHAKMLRGHETDRAVVVKHVDSMAPVVLATKLPRRGRRRKFGLKGYRGAA